MTFSFPSEAPLHNLSEAELPFLEKKRMQVLNILQLKVDVILKSIDITFNELFTKEYKKQHECFANLKERVALINVDAQITLLLAESIEGIKHCMKERFDELAELSKQWPIAFQTLEATKSQLAGRMEYAMKTFAPYLNDSDELEFTALKAESEKIIGNAKKEILQASSDEEIDQIIENAANSLKKLSTVLGQKIEIVGFPDMKKKLDARLRELQKKFPDLNLESEEKKIEAIMNDAQLRIDSAQIDANHLWALSETIDAFEEIDMSIEQIIKRIANKHLIISNAMDAFEKIDMSIEKIVAIRGIQQRYEEIIKTILQYQQPDLNFSEEISYAMVSFEGSKSRILNLCDPISPSGMNRESQLFVATNGTLSTLERILKEVLVKYGEHKMRSAMNRLPYNYGRLGTLEGIGSEEKKKLTRLKKQLIDSAREELVWGENKMARVAPPLIPESKMLDTLEQQIISASLTVYLNYVEECIRKSLKFNKVRNQWEGFSDEDLNELEKNGEQIIQEAKSAIESQIKIDPHTLLERGPNVEIETIINAIIDDSIAKIKML